MTLQRRAEKRLNRVGNALHVLDRRCGEGTDPVGESFLGNFLLVFGNQEKCPPFAETDSPRWRR